MDLREFTLFASEIRQPTLVLKPEEASPEIQNRCTMGPKYCSSICIIRHYCLIWTRVTQGYSGFLSTDCSQALRALRFRLWIQSGLWIQVVNPGCWLWMSRRHLTCSPLINYLPDHLPLPAPLPLSPPPAQTPLKASHTSQFGWRFNQ